jgi:hypothetical protein
MNRPTITLNDAWVYLKASLAGFLITASGYLGVALSLSIQKYIFRYLASPAKQTITALAILITLIAYTWLRGAPTQLLKITKSIRLDLLITCVFGSIVSFCIAPNLNQLYADALLHAHPVWILVILGFSLLFFAVTTVDAAFRELVKMMRAQASPIFMNDAELQSTSTDLLDASDAASRFATQIWNGGSSDSLVFGLDAPWGIGKSTFINFTLEHLKKIEGANAITFKFNPLKYHDKTKLLDKLIDGLRNEITTTLFVPELATLLTNYSKLISGKVGLTVFGIRLDSAETSVDATYNELERALSRLNRKVLVIIDDLDRIDYAEVKEVLFTIKKSFMLPNVSYILSYDTENILALDKETNDSEKVREFMEKFVNIKTSLFLDSSKLAAYVTTNFNEACSHNLLLDPVTVSKTTGALDALKQIFNSADFYQYYPVIGDVRKLKRLVNTILSLEIEKTEFENTDFDKSDLLHLLLIYLNYPHIFRAIYNTETNGRDGFFSAVGKLHQWYPKSKSDEGPVSGWQNSLRYHEYVKGLTPTQSLLVEKVFSIPSKLGSPATDVTERDQAVLACFNQKGTDRNLERYLNLIVKTSKPVEHKQYNFYAAQAKKIISGDQFAAVFNDKRFNFADGEYAHQYFWRVFVNQARTLKLRDVDRAIDYLVQQLPKYSTIEVKGLDLGFRSFAPLYLLKLLNDAGWEDRNGSHTDNTTSNIANIAHHIFGEQTYINAGLISQLTIDARGVLGLYDALVLRLYSCANRDTNYFNLHRSLAKHGDRKAITEGPVNLIAIGEMRELSQKIAKEFLERYRDQSRCVLKEIDALSIAELSGETHKLVKAKTHSGTIRQEAVELAAKTARSRLKTFITNQLGGIDTNSGVTCGYYNLYGNDDSREISVLINNYLFDVCFNPTIQANAYETFLDFLMVSYPENFHWSGNEPKPSMQSFTRVLYKHSLAEYWHEHSAAIRAENYGLKEKEIYTSNYKLSYKKHLSDIFDLLDELPIKQP